MTARLLLLEFRRNRLSALSAALAFLATLPVCRLVSTTTGLAPQLALEAALTAWILLGTPLAAALIGAASGSAAAAADALDAETLLPLSSERRAAASMAVALLLSVAFAAFLLSASTLLGVAADRVLAVNEKNWGQSFWYSLQVSPFLAAVCLDALAGGWALSRLLGNGVAGGLLALLATTSSFLAVAVSFGLEIEHHEWGVDALTAACVVAGAGILAKFAAGALAARASERRTGLAGPALAAALVAAGPALAWIPLVRELSALNGRLRQAEHGPSHWYQSPDDRFPRGARALAAAGEGFAFETVRGGVVLAGAAGIREVVPEKGTGLWSLLYEPFSVNIRRVLRDSGGRLWVERYMSPNTELWREAGGRAEMRVQTRGDGGSTTIAGGAVAKYRFFDGRTESLARLEDYFERGDRARWVVGQDAFVEESARAARAARPACGGRCLKAGGLTWSLPGRALAKDPVYPDEIGGKPAYLLPVRTAAGLRVAFCRPDGATVIAWPLRLRSSGHWPEYQSLPDGTLFAFGRERTLWSIAPDGTTRAPIPLAGLWSGLPRGREEFPDVVRIDADGADLVWAGRAYRVDSRGRMVSSRRLPGGVDAAVGMKGGFIALSPRDSYFVGWDGGVRALRKP